MNKQSSALVIALDRSRSMAGEPLDAAKREVTALVRRDLGFEDALGVVAFDRSAEVVVPAGRLSDPEVVLARVDALGVGSGSDLGGGYLRALREVIRVADDGAGMLGRVLVLSDGRVDRGITRPDGLLRIARQACAEGIVTSTLACGEAYDGELLAGLARDGGGTFAVAS